MLRWEKVKVYWQDIEDFGRKKDAIAALADIQKDFPTWKLRAVKVKKGWWAVQGTPR